MISQFNWYEVFNGNDFYDQSSDTKDILQTLTNATHLQPLSLDQVGVDQGLAHFDPSALNGTSGRYTDYIDGKLDSGLVYDCLWEEDPADPKSILNPYESELASDLDSRYWESKPPDQWTSEDVWHWIFSWAGDRNIDVEEVQPLAYSNMTGQQLCQMSRNDFVTINPKYGGLIFETLQQLSNQFRIQIGSNLNVNNGSPDFNFFPNLPSFDLLRSSCLDIECHGNSPSSASDSDRESTSSSMTTVNERNNGSHLLAVSTASPLPSISVHPMIDNQSINKTLNPSLTGSPLAVPVKKVGRRGRPPKKDAKSRNRQGKGNGKLWEFIRDLLLDQATNPSLIRWERREDGIFKFVQSDKVAKLWGQRKQNPRMTYEKLSRAMRYYYKSQVLLPVFGRRLVYKFGPNATGWRPHPISGMGN